MVFFYHCGMELLLAEVVYTIEAPKPSGISRKVSKAENGWRPSGALRDGSLPHIMLTQLTEIFTNYV
jgi:hypothetical protein